MSLTEAEAEAFLSEPKSLFGEVVWKPTSDAQFIYKAVAKVLLSQSGDTSTLNLVSCMGG